MPVVQACKEFMPRRAHETSQWRAIALVDGGVVSWHGPFNYADVTSRGSGSIGAASARRVGRAPSIITGVGSCIGLARWGSWAPARLDHTVILAAGGPRRTGGYKRLLPQGGSSYSPVRWGPRLDETSRSGIEVIGLGIRSMTLPWKCGVFSGGSTHGN